MNLGLFFYDFVDGYRREWRECFVVFLFICFYKVFRNGLERKFNKYFFGLGWYNIVLRLLNLNLVICYLIIGMCFKKYNDFVIM